MRKILASLGLTGLFLFVTMTLWAQEKMTDEPVQMADGLRSSGKIYVVVAVVVTIIAGLFAYLIHLEKKINRLEKK
jgi:hypothetical protein